MKDTLEEIKAEIEQLRDELRLKAHLGKAEAKDELEKLEKKWNAFLKEYKPVTDEAEKTAKNTIAALGVAADATSVFASCFECSSSPMGTHNHRKTLVKQERALLFCPTLVYRKIEGRPPFFRAE